MSDIILLTAIMLRNKQMNQTFMNALPSKIVNLNFMRASKYACLPCGLCSDCKRSKYLIDNK